MMTAASSHGLSRLLTPLIVFAVAHVASCISVVPLSAAHDRRLRRSRASLMQVEAKAKAAVQSPVGADFFEENLTSSFRRYSASAASVVGNGIAPSWFSAQLPQTWTPAPLSELVDWKFTRVNTTLACPDPGCSASVSLTAFNPSTEIARDCRLSISVYPTDFDDMFSGERVTFISVNGEKVSQDCFPNAAGCGPRGTTDMISCLDGFPLGDLLQESGVANVSAGISDMVDECPYQGNHFSSLATIACWVATIPASESLQSLLKSNASSSTNSSSSSSSSASGSQATGYGTETTETTVLLSAPLQCPERGCQADATLNLIDVLSRANKNIEAVGIKYCLMNVTIQQSDFDNLDGEVEAIEFVNVSNYQLVTNAKPGGNPCRDLWQGKPGVEKPFPAVTQLLVTPLVKQGPILVTAKISPHVDECASNGYLLDGEVTMLCDVTILTASPTVQTTTAAETTTTAETVVFAETGDRETLQEGAELPATT